MHNDVLCGMKNTDEFIIKLIIIMSIILSLRQLLVV